VSQDVVSLAQALIRCRSVTPDDDGALAILAQWLAGVGFELERPVFSEPGTPDVENLFARIGAGSPCFVFAGHTDVVPPGAADRWRHDPFGGVVEDGWLYGRGAADMKGGIAAMAAAAAAFIRDRGPGLPGSVAFLITGDEEGPALNGTVKLLQWALARGEHFSHCVLAEPTNPERLGDMVKIGRRGSLTGRITVRGRQGHVAYPELARNPIPALAKMVAALSSEPLDEGTKHFGRSNLEWTTIDTGNPATNVVPAEARATFNIRFNDRWTPEGLEEEIRGRLGRSLTGETSFEFVCDPTNASAFLTPPDPFVDLVRNAVAAETGMVPALSTTGGTSDARFIKDICPVVEFGLVGQSMHAIDERVRVDDLQRLSAVYRRILESYFPDGSAIP